MSLQLTANPLTRSIGTAVLCFLAVIAGLVAGNIFIGSGESVILERPPSGADLPRMILAPGDLFPHEPFRSVEGKPGNMEDLLGGASALVYFVEPNCQACNSLLKFRQHRLRSRLAMKTTEIILVPDSFDSVPIEYTGLFEGATVAFYNREYWEKTYHQVFWPTLVGVDESGFILHVQYGFTGALDHEVVSRFLTSPE